MNERKKRRDGVRYVAPESHASQRIRLNQSKCYALTENGKYLHREIYKAVHGPIPLGWIVHHLNGNSLDNRIDNLMALPTKFHDRLHHWQRKQGRLIGREEIGRLLEEEQTHYQELEKKIEEWETQIIALRKKIKGAKDRLTNADRDFDWIR